MLSINFSPFPVLQTTRLILRCVTVADAPQLFELRSDPKTMQWLDREPQKNIAEAVSFINEKLIASLIKNEGIAWMIELKEKPGRMIGFTGFWRIDKDNYRAEIGYMIHSDYWQKGFTKEAVQKTIEWAFSKTDIHSIEANINPANEASEALLKSTGFVKEAYFKENYYFNGVFKDSIIYSLVKPQQNKAQ